MKITDLHINGFGVWSDLSVDELSGSLTVFYGPNEAGKTTLMQFVRTVLYGLTPERRTRYYPPVQEGSSGGWMRLSGPHGIFDVARDLNEANANDSLGALSVTRPDGSVLGSHQIGSLLSNVDESIFNNVFAFSLRELQELGTLDDTEASDLLYKLASGLDRVSIVDVMRSLANSRNQLLSQDDEPCEIVDLIEQRDKLQVDIAQLSDSSRNWSALATERISVQQEIGALESLTTQLEEDAQLNGMALKIQEDWVARTAIQEQITALGEITTVAPRSIERLDKLNQSIAQRRGQLDQFKHQCVRLRDEYAALPVDGKLWACSCRIEALKEHTPWIVSLENQIAWLRQELAKSQSDLEARGDELALPMDAIRDRLPDIAKQAGAMLEGPARELRDEEERLATIKNECTSSNEEAKEMVRHLEDVLVEHGQNDLENALEAANNNVEKLRRRVDVEERIDKMGRHRTELDEDRQDLLEEQMLPLQRIVAIGCVFALGVLLVLVGTGIWISSTSFPGFVLVPIGLALAGFAGATKFVMERNAEQELEDCEEQLEKLRRQLKRAKEEREELDEELGTGGGALDARLRAAESDLEKLEELVPLNTECQAAVQRSNAADRRISEAKQAVKEAHERWRTVLKRAGLPENLAPEHVAQLAEGVEQMSHTVRQLGSRGQELEARTSELDAINERVRSLLEEVAINPASDDPRAQIGQLTDALARQNHLVDRRREIKKQYKEARRELTRSHRGLDKLENRRTAMFAAVGVDEEADFRTLARRHAQYLSLCEERDALTSRIAVVLGEQFTEAMIDQEFDPHRDESLEQRKERIDAKLRESEARLAQLHQRRGEISQEIKSLTKDRQLSVARFELGCVEQKLAKAIRNWRSLAVTGNLLEDICRAYEADRQPETLNAASRYLEQMTEGRYPRVWTPMHDNSLRVDNEQDDSLPVEVLSRGTREAVFISLRLALIDAYARRGIVLPLILDDVLVNFDLRRAKAAARVLRDFADLGHQLLLFTCHEHIMKLFVTSQVEVRVLPDRFGSVDGTPEMGEEIGFVTTTDTDVVGIEEPTIEEPPAEQVITEEPVVEESEEVHEPSDEDEWEYTTDEEQSEDLEPVNAELEEEYYEEFVDDDESDLGETWESPTRWWDSPRQEANAPESSDFAELLDRQT